MAPRGRAGAEPGRDPAHRAARAAGAPVPSYPDRSAVRPSSRAAPLPSFLAGATPPPTEHAPRHSADRAKPPAHTACAPQRVAPRQAPCALPPRPAQLALDLPPSRNPWMLPRPNESHRRRNGHGGSNSRGRSADRESPVRHYLPWPSCPPKGSRTKGVTAEAHRIARSSAPPKLGCCCCTIHSTCWMVSSQRPRFPWFIPRVPLLAIAQPSIACRLTHVNREHGPRSEGQRPGDTRSRPVRMLYGRCLEGVLERGVEGREDVPATACCAKDDFDAEHTPIPT